MKNVSKILILLCFFLVSCGYNSVGSKIKNLIFGKPAVVEQTNQNELVPSEPLPIGDIEPSVLTNIEKLSELLRAYSYTPSPDVASMILDQLSLSLSEIDKNKDEFLANITVLAEKYLPIEEGDSIKLLIRIYSRLSGPIKIEVAKILSSGFEDGPDAFVNAYMEVLASDNCEIVKYVNNKVTMEHGQSYTTYYLKERRTHLSESQNKRMLICLHRLDAELGR